jgi:hypothetical protein
MSSIPDGNTRLKGLQTQIRVCLKVSSEHSGERERQKAKEGHRDTRPEEVI